MPTELQKAATGLRLHQFIQLYFQGGWLCKYKFLLITKFSRNEVFVFYSFQSKIYLPTFLEIQRTRDLSRS